MNRKRGEVGVVSGEASTPWRPRPSLDRDSWKIDGIPGRTRLGRDVLLATLRELPAPYGRWHPIHRLLKVCRITQVTMGAETGYSHTYVSLTGRGLIRANPLYKQRAADYLGVEQALLFRCDDDLWSTSDGEE